MSDNNINESENKIELDIIRNKEQMEYGIKLIISAYENKGIIYENDIKLLLEEVNNKENIIKELLVNLDKVCKERDFYKSSYEQSNEDNKKLTELYHKLKKDNKNYKSKLYNSDDVSYETNLIQNLKEYKKSISDIDIKEEPHTNHKGNLLRLSRNYKYNQNGYNKIIKNR